MRLIRVLGWLCVGLCGCMMMQNEGPAKKLTDTLVTMNKATRWGQLGQAERMVEPVYRTRFIQTHAHWGQIIQVADSDIVHMEMTADHETAVAMVSYDWYLLSAMTLHTTVVQQRWAQVNESFMLASESVVQGDARLLAPVPGVRPGLPESTTAPAEEVSALAP